MAKMIKQPTRNTKERWTFLADLNFCCIASSKVGFEIPGALHLEKENEIWAFKLKLTIELHSQIHKLFTMDPVGE